MYHGLYNLGIRLYGWGIHLAASFNPKAKEWVCGRKSLFKNLKSELAGDHKIIWLHAASLGEAEQGVPIMQALKKQHPEYRILLTFFSPSGMKHFKNNGLADHIFYLPIDSPSNARKFISLVKPSLAFFIKYEIWANYFMELQRNHIPHVIAPAIFRAEQIYFKKPHRSFFLPLLRKVNSIMVQDENSAQLLHKEAITNVKVVGDSRFDRVLQNTQTEFKDECLDAFCENQSVLIGGSTWPPGEKILKEIQKHHPKLRMIIAPHDISEENIKRVQRLFGTKHSFRYSQPPDDPASFQVCIIDNIGLLSRLYRYGQLAYIGGAFGRGIHNSLEAAAYGLPLFFGPNHRNFIEPAEMIKAGFGHEIQNSDDLLARINPLLNDSEELRSQSEKALNYVKSKAGVVSKIMEEVSSLL